MPYVDPADALNARRTAVSSASVAPDEPWSRLRLIGDRPLRVVQLTMRWGDRTIPHYHPRSAEFFYLLAGGATFWIGSEPPVRAAPGDLLYAAPTVVHAIVAGEDGVRFLAGNAPNEDAPDEQIDEEIEGYPG
jgi:quercetin dioxygenase-like cupin family protein